MESVTQTEPPPTATAATPLPRSIGFPAILSLAASIRVSVPSDSESTQIFSDPAAIRSGGSPTATGADTDGPESPA